MSGRCSNLAVMTSRIPTNKPRDHAQRRVEELTGKSVPNALLDALREEKGNVSAVARRFGVDRVTVYDWMDRYGIERRQVFTAA